MSLFVSPYQRRLRRNDIVVQKSQQGNGFFPGRVWRRLDDNRVQVLMTGAHVVIFRDDELLLSNYKGRWVWQRHPGNDRGKKPIWLPMTSLRQMKKYASQYNAHFGGRHSWGKRWTKEERVNALTDRSMS